VAIAQSCKKILIVAAQMHPSNIHTQIIFSRAEKGRAEWEWAQNVSARMNFLKSSTNALRYRPPQKRAIMSKQTGFLLPPAPDDHIYTADFYFVPGRRALGLFRNKQRSDQSRWFSFLAAAVCKRSERNISLKGFASRPQLISGMEEIRTQQTSSLRVNISSSNTSSSFSDVKPEQQGINPNMLGVFCHFADEIFGAIISLNHGTAFWFQKSDSCLHSPMIKHQIYLKQKRQLIFCLQVNFVIN
jgi:hypothetical protein